MIRKYGYTCLTLLLSGMVVLGSMCGMKQILERRTGQLLTERGEAVVQSFVFEEPEPDNGLTLEQARGAIKSWNNRTLEMVHDPVERQLSMEQAVNRGNEWLTVMGVGASGTRTAENLELRSAVLSIGMQDGQEQEVRYPYDSFWTLQYTGAAMDATLYLNAVTGGVWDAEVRLYDAALDKTLRESLEIFVELTELPFSKTVRSMEKVDRGYVVMYREEGFFAWVEMREVELADRRTAVYEYPGTDKVRERYVVLSYHLAGE